MEDVRAKERFADAADLKMLRVGIGGWKWKPERPRPQWEALKTALVWSDSRYKSLRDSLRKPAGLPTVVVTSDEQRIRCVDFHRLGPEPDYDEDEEAEQGGQPGAESSGEAGQSRGRRRRGFDTEQEEEVMHIRRLYMYKAVGELPEIADKCHVGIILIQAPPGATVRLPPQVCRLLDHTPVAIYGSPANVSGVVEELRRLVGDRERQQVDVWVRPKESVGTGSLVKRILVLMSKPEWVRRTRVCAAVS